VPAGGGASTQLAAGVWVRSSAIDANAIYFVNYNDKDVKRFDLATNQMTSLISGNSSEGGVFIDSNNVYLNIAGSIKQVAKSGGTVTTLVNTGTAHGYTSDGSFVYFVDGASLQQVPLSGGAIQTLATVPAGQITSIAVDANYIYWADLSSGGGAGQILRMPKPVATMPVSSSAAISAVPHDARPLPAPAGTTEWESALNLEDRSQQYEMVGIFSDEAIAGSV
jgi:hypothetical protein